MIPHDIFLSLVNIFVIEPFFPIRNILLAFTAVDRKCSLYSKYYNLGNMIFYKPQISQSNSILYNWPVFIVVDTKDFKINLLWYKIKYQDFFSTMLVFLHARILLVIQTFHKK